jgi:pre-mRNA-splicing factor ISY1
LILFFCSCFGFQAMLNRFWKAKSDEARGPTSKRPHLASECNDLPEAERWRGQIVREIGRKVAEVQNGSCLISR